MIQKGTNCYQYLNVFYWIDADYHLNINDVVLYLSWQHTRSSDLCLSSDQEQLDKEINDLRKGLKAKVNRLNVIQGNRRTHSMQI